jgi:hypothetical protein
MVQEIVHVVYACDKESVHMARVLGAFKSHDTAHIWWEILRNLGRVLQPNQRNPIDPSWYMGTEYKVMAVGLDAAIGIGLGPADRNNNKQ